MNDIFKYLKQCCVPEYWKLGEVILILKKNPPTDIDNHHPITLISCICKLLTNIFFTPGVIRS